MSFSINTHVDSSTFRPLICESRCLFFSHLLAFYLPFSGVRTLQVVFAIWWRLVVGVTHLPPGRFGHYVRQALPEAMRVLDMQDFHALRLGTPAAFYVVLPFNRHMKTNDTHGLIMFVSWLCLMVNICQKAKARNFPFRCVITWCSVFGLDSILFYFEFVCSMFHDDDGEEAVSSARSLAILGENPNPHILNWALTIFYIFYDIFN